MNLTCLHCGGGLPPAAAHAPVACPFCGATSVPPPKVVERVVERVIVAVPAGEPGPARLHCPRCAGGLTEKQVRQSVLAGCQACGGLWIDAATVERLKKARDEELERAARRMHGVLMVRGPAPNRMAAISCPVCAAPLRRVEIPDTMHSVDVCEAHGTWFDRDNGDELRMFVTAFEDARAGVVTEDDLQHAGVPGAGGFFARLFRSGG
jgi:Zn-finger nucleic acid-binding protein